MGISGVRREDVRSAQNSQKRGRKVALDQVMGGAGGI